VDKEQLLVILNELDLNQLDLARLLSVNVRTVRRWLADKIPKEVEFTVLAWQKLHRLNMPWRPNSIDILSESIPSDVIFPNG